MKGAWYRDYYGLAPGSKSNNMAAVVEVNVSPQIDDFVNSLNFYEEKGVPIWKQYLILTWDTFSDVNIDWRESESLKTPG